jgi:bacterioferritin-associated ferredoxin
MIVCHCAALNDTSIRAAVLAGALDADDVSDLCGAGKQCGGCYEVVESLVESIVGISSRSTAPIAA